MDKQIVLAVVALLAVTVTVSADPIFVENWSFENPGTGKPGFDLIPGWTGEGSGGGGAETNWGPTDGLYTGFCGGNMDVFQLTGHTIVANAEYTLTIDARRTWEGPSITLELYYDSAGARVPMESLLHQFVGGSTTDMEELTLTVASNDSPQSIGNSLGIQFKSADPDAAWIGYDSVRLDYVVLGPVVNASDPSPSDAATDACLDTILMWLPGELAVTHEVYLGTDFDDVNEATTTVDPQGVYRGQVSVAQFDISTALIPEYGQTYYWRIDEVDGPPANARHKGDVWQFTAEPFSYQINDVTATASSSGLGKGPEKTLNLQGDLHSNTTSDMWLSGNEPAGAWILYQFGKIYKLHEMWVWNYNGEFPLTWYGFRNVIIEYSIDGVDYTELGTAREFEQALGTAGYARGTTVDFDGAAAKYVRISAASNHSGGAFDRYGLSEVRFLRMPMRAAKLYPEDGAPDVPLDAVLSWRAGRGAAAHDVYVSTNKRAVSEGTVAPVSIPADDSCGSSYDISLDLNKTYYWKVNEINMADEPDTWEDQDVWSFSTPEYLVVDDMESYGDAAIIGQPGSNVWYTWKDGEGWAGPEPSYEGNGSGSVVELSTNPAFDRQSLACRYDNDGTNAIGTLGKKYYSEVIAAIADLPIGPDWTQASVKSLSLRFYGDPDNDAGLTEQMYVKLNGFRIPYDGDMSDITEASWHEWNIDLTLFGISLQNVTQIAIGFGDENNTVQAGSGVVYFDEIRLYPSRCILSRRTADFARADYIQDCAVDYKELEAMSEDWLLVVEPPGDAYLVGWWMLDDGSGTTAVDSSAHGNHGTLNGDPQWVAGYDGEALEFDGVGDYVEVPHDASLTVDTEVTVMAWINAQRHPGPAGDWQGILAKGNSPRSYSFYTYVNGSLHFSTTSGGAYVGSTSTGKVPLNEWVHVAAMVADGQHLYYINGEPAGTGGGGITLPGAADTATVMIGMTNETGNEFLGMIDDVRIYNKALTQEEIFSLMGSPTDLNEDNKINFKDYAVLLDHWLETQLWP
ncbi:MAG: LamG-like jellyroll fold domain-containing protein [Planctomycetota bacterium]|jgi:hypothetical protein